jgi:hypothetical protein
MFDGFLVLFLLYNIYGAGVFRSKMCVRVYGKNNTTARVTIENFWARRGRDAGETRARTFTNFDRGTVDFRHMGVLVSRICTKVYSEESFGDLSILSHSIE